MARVIRLNEILADGRRYEDGMLPADVTEELAGMLLDLEHDLSDSRELRVA